LLFLKLLLRGPASDWLAQCGLITWTVVLPAFKIRFDQTDLKQWQNVAYDWSSKQFRGFETDAYVTNIQRMAASAGLNVGQLSRRMKGLSVSAVTDRAAYTTPQGNLGQQPGVPAGHVRGLWRLWRLWRLQRLPWRSRT
jgi:hypothetical protein